MRYLRRASFSFGVSALSLIEMRGGVAASILANSYSLSSRAAISSVTRATFFCASASPEYFTKVLNSVYLSSASLRSLFQ